MKRILLLGLIVCFGISLTMYCGCNLANGTDELFSILNIEIDKDFEYYDSKTDETVEGHIKISGNDVEYSDSNGNSGSGSLENETITASFSRPGESGTLTAEFSNFFEDYSGVIEFSDGRVITFSSSD